MIDDDTQFEELAQALADKLVLDFDEQSLRAYVWDSIFTELLSKTSEDLRLIAEHNFPELT